VVIESLAAGTAVLISDKVGLADYVAENNLGWLCKTNPASISAAINDVFLNRKAALKKIRENAFSIVSDDFNEANLTTKYIALYQSIIKPT
jgi:glycosyltransferase involved in cell wall biosynthesis